MRNLLLTLITLGLAHLSMSQEPVHWNFSIKKVSDKTYELTCKASVEEPWHVYSQTTPDGGPVATQFTFNKNPLLIFQGDVKENGKMIERYEDVFGVNVKYFDGDVSFVQVIKLKANAKTNVSGSVKFMTCNDEQCLPPRSVPFSIALQ